MTVPAGLDSASDWPGLMRPLVERHGVEAVWIAGLVALGYPANLVRSYDEVTRVRQQIDLNKQPTPTEE